MSDRRRTHLAGALAACVLAACAATSAAASLPVYLYTGKFVAKPTRYVYTGDGSGYLTHIAWHGWGPSGAAASAIVNVNDCTPNCAQGRFHAAPATATFSRARRCGSRLVYSRMVLHVPGHASWSGTWPLLVPTGSRCR